MECDITTRDGFMRRLAPLADQVVGVARRMVDASDDADDVIQSALAAAWAHRLRYVEGTNFRAWIFRFVVHESWNANRRRSRSRVRRIEDDDVPDGSFWARLDADLAYRELLEDPAALYERLDQRLSGAIRRIGDEERAVLLLRAVAGLTCAEIAAALEVPKGTVMARLFRARIKIREHLAAVADDAPIGRAGR